MRRNGTNHPYEMLHNLSPNYKECVGYVGSLSIFAGLVFLHPKYVKCSNSFIVFLGLTYRVFSVSISTFPAFLNG